MTAAVVANVHRAACAPMLFFSCPVPLCSNRGCEKAQGCGWDSQCCQKQFEIGWAEADLFFWPVFSDPENVCINSHSQLEARLYYDSVDQYILRTMNYDRWADNCMKGLIGLSGNEVAL